jgi:hypothetical protein
MNLEILPTDIILLIIQFIPDNFSSTSFIKTCKHIRNIGKKYGYIKHIEVNYRINFFDFVDRCSTHQDTICSIKIKDLLNPELWIPIAWPKYIHISFCSIRNIIDPPLSRTEKIEISSYDSILRINWKKFPNLKHIRISCKNIDFNGLENCTNIEIIFIHLSETKVVLPKFICNFKKLIQISTNCHIPPNLFFISDKLVKCICGNNQTYSSPNFINHPTSLYCNPNIF